MTDRSEARKKQYGSHSEGQQSLAGQTAHSGGATSFDSTISSGRAAATAGGSSVPSDDDFPALSRETQATTRQKKDQALQQYAAGSSRARPSALASTHTQAAQALQAVQAVQYATPIAGRTRADAGYNLDALAADCILQLHNDGKHVSVSDVEKLMCRRIGCDRLPLGGKHITAVVPRIKQLDRDLNRIQVYIQAYLLNPVCTVHDLGQKLAASMTDDSKKTSFNDLGLGPLTKIPTVYERFKCPETVVEISPADIISFMRKCLDHTNGNDPNGRVTAEGFMLQLAKDHGCCEDDVYRLGVKIRSIPLLIQEVARAKREANATLRDARERQKTELLDELAKQMNLLKRYFTEALDRRTDRGVSLRRKYMHMSPLDVLKDAWQRCSEYVTTSRVKEKVITLLTELSRDPTASQIFQLAVCSAHVSVPADSEGMSGSNVSPSLASTSGRSGQEQPSTGVAAAAAAGAASQPRSTVSRKEIMEAIKRSLSRRNVEFLRIEDLKVLEEDLGRTLKVKNFFECGYGSFLAFFDGCAKVLQEAGLNLVLSADDGVRLRELRTLAVAFSRHYCSVTGSSTQLTLAEQGELVKRLRIQFGVTHLHELGVTSLQSLLNFAGLAVDQSGHRGEGDCSQHNRKAGAPSTITHTLAQHDQPVLFEVACIRGEAGDGVADLGSSIVVNQTEHSALQCILNTPLLEDIKSWTQWNLVFYDQLGDITKFIMKNYKKVSNEGFGAQAAYGLRALLTQDGRLLRIPANGCSVDAFGSRVAAADARGAAACLAGLACVKGTAALPQQLLASHVQKKLVEMGSRSAADIRLKQADGHRTSTPLLLDFVFTALVLLPLQIAQHVARQVFLAPLAAALGSQTKAESDLYILSKSRGQDAVFERLGLMLGIRGWAESFEQKLEPMDTIIEATSAAEDLADDRANDSPEKTIGHNKEKENEKSTDEETQVKSEKKLATQAKTDQSDRNSANISDVSTNSAVTPVLKTNDEACRAVITDIRKNYNVDSEHKESDASLNLKKQLGNSLERLSRELYNTNTHFVLELIQNADDNRYTSGVTPTLFFVIDNSSIVLYNNEEGFSELDIRAISAIGQSTKGKHKQGYIGQKGIGFKSVFTVTDSPAVHSNGYHISFDLRQGPMGYILPTWVQEKPPAAPTGHVLKDLSWNTTIVLPLKDDGDEDHCSFQSLANSFYDLKPILLLFLHRLRQISFIIKTEQNKTINMRRKDISQHLLQLEFDKLSHLWLVSRMRLGALEELQVDVESTELSLAFPVFQEKKQYEQYLTKPEKKPVKQQTFAYLPLRDFGFKFVLQADFEIPSSRQDVRHDSKWNEWIREAVPQAFMQSRELFLELKNLDSIEATIYFLKFVPLPGEITGFFEPVVQGVLERLWRTPVIPIKSKEKVVEWKLPSEVIICPKEVQALVPASLLNDKLHLHYAIPQFVDGLGEELLMNMGVRRLDSQTVLELLQTLYEDYQAKNQNFPLKDCAKWLSTMYHFINDDYRHTTISAIAAMKIFWLSDKSVTHIRKNETVFMPETSGHANDQSALRLLKSDLLIISDELLVCQNELANAQVKEMLDLLGVRSPTTSEIINDHIIPTLRSSEWRKKAVNILVAYTQILFLDWIENKNAEWLQHSKCYLPFLTSKGETVCPAERDIFLTPQYLNSINLAKTYPAYQWRLISDVYISKGASDRVRQDWKEFLVLHGLKENFEVELQKSSRSRATLENTVWRDYLGIVPHDITDELDVEDYDCTVLRELLDSGDPTTLINVYEELVRNWDRRYSSAEVARIRIPQRKQPLELPSTFVLMLRSRDWMPCTAATGQGHFRNPSTIWLAHRDLKALLDHTVEYALAIDAAPSVKFCEAVKLNYKLSAEHLLEFLKKWSQAANATKDTAAANTSPTVPFVTSVPHMSRVYLHLRQFDFTREYFQNEALVFIPTEVDNKTQPGHFVPLKVLRWSDPTRLFAKYRPDFFDEQTGENLSYIFIESYYHELKDFFLKFLNIEEEPSLRQYCLLLQYISQSDPALIKESFKDAIVVYSALGRKCQIDTPQGFIVNPQYAGPLKACASEMPILASSAGIWTHLTERLLLDDDPDLGDLFRQAKKPVAFLAVEEKDISGDVLRFCEALKIQKLSEKVERESVVEGLRPSPRAYNYVSQLLPWVQRFLLSKPSRRTLYEDLSCAGNAGTGFPESRLCNIFQVRSLELVVRLTGWDDCTVQCAKHCEYFDSERNIYLQYSVVEGEHANKMYNYVNDALASVLRTNETSYSQLKEEIDGFLSRAKSFLVDGFPENENDFIRKNSIQSIPDGVRPWALPKLKSAPAAEEKVLEVPRNEKQEEIYADLADTPPASESTGGLTCWPPRQYDCSQATGLQKGSTAARQLLPDYAKKVPPPPTTGDSVDETTDGNNANSGESPARRVPNRDGVPGQTFTVATDHVKQLQSTPALATGKHDHESKLQRAADAAPAGQANSAAISASPDSKATNVSVEDRASIRSDEDAAIVRPEKSGGKQRRATGATDKISEQLGVLQCLDFSQLDSLPEVVPMETDIGVLLSSLNPDLFVQHDRVADQAVGYRGELLVYHYLCKKQEAAVREGDVTIEWMNSSGEVGQPYDIVVRDLVKKRTSYIEVKSTRTEDKCCFELSINQVKFALENTGDYSLYRIYNAGSPTVADAKLRILNDLSSMMNTKKVGLYIII